MRKAWRASGACYTAGSRKSMLDPVRPRETGRGRGPPARACRTRSTPISKRLGQHPAAGRAKLKAADSGNAVRPASSGLARKALKSWASIDALGDARSRPSPALRREGALSWRTRCKAGNRCAAWLGLSAEAEHGLCPKRCAGLARERARPLGAATVSVAMGLSFGKTVPAFGSRARRRCGSAGAISASARKNSISPPRRPSPRTSPRPRSTPRRRRWFRARCARLSSRKGPPPVSGPAARKGANYPPNSARVRRACRASPRTPRAPPSIGRRASRVRGP